MADKNLLEFIEALSGEKSCVRLSYLMQVSMGRKVLQDREKISKEEQFKEDEDFLKKVLDQLELQKCYLDVTSFEKVKAWWFQLEEQAMTDLLEAAKTYKEANNEEPGQPIFTIRRTDMILEDTPDEMSAVDFTISFP